MITSGLKEFAEVGTFTYDGQRRVSFNFEEDFRFNTRCFQYGSDRSA